MTSHTRRCFVPPHVADRLATEIGHPASAERDLREHRRELLAAGAQAHAPGDVVAVYDSHQRQSTSGATYLTEPYSDPRANEAETGLQATLALLRDMGETFADEGVSAYVNYGRDYDNAFWDGDEMVFGNGDGQVFGPFTKPIDVCSHELGHGVTGDLLDYQDQAGALNESMSDCQGAVTRQRALGLAVHDDGAWLIGAKAELFLPAFTGRALRDMLNPGTAYRDDPMLGDDPQPAHMDAYDHTSDDDGGVHINSGIPNRAFALAASAHGDSLAVLRIWRTALGDVNDPSCTFAKFAQATVAAAGDLATVVQGAWVTVGVLQASTPQPPSPTPTGPGGGSGSSAPFPGADPAVASHVMAAADRAGMSLADWLNHHFRKYFRLR